MAEIECACNGFKQIEGLSATLAYISQFLDQTDEEAGKTWYACRVCGAPWVREVTEGNHRPLLTQLETEFNV